GPGAHAFDGRARRWNAAHLDAYAAALAAGSLPPGGHEPIDDAVAAAETIVLALRTDDGVAADEIDAGPFGPTITWALDEGLASRDSDDRVRLTTRGRLLSNEVFTRLI
ncbi:MAG: coproporphyrinogen III oxidase, partial [Mycobacteriales bacterium]